MDNELLKQIEENTRATKKAVRLLITFFLWLTTAVMVGYGVGFLFLVATGNALVSIAAFAGVTTAGISITIRRLSRKVKHEL